MVITDRFVYIHQPKTGGTFVTSVLTKIHGSLEGRSPLTKRLSLLARKGFIKYKNKHGTCFEIYRNKHRTCSEIPFAERNKLIVATIRNPYDRYVSQYVFGWWKKKKYLKNYNLKEIKAKFPSFPDINFEEFVNLTSKYFIELNNSNFSQANKLGWHTEQFVRYFFKNPKVVYPLIDEDYISEKRYYSDMFKIKFLKTENLNSELHDFLLSIGYDEESIDFIKHQERILPKEGGRNKQDKWSKYYTSKLKNLVRTKERLLFKIFPEFDV
jgi:hypothetical protein